MMAHWKEDVHGCCWSTQKTYFLLDPGHKNFLNFFLILVKKCSFWGVWRAMFNNFFGANKHHSMCLRYILTMCSIISFVLMHLKRIHRTHKWWGKKSMVFRFWCHTAHLAEKRASHSDSLSKPNWYLFLLYDGSLERERSWLLLKHSKKYFLLDPGHKNFLILPKKCSFWGVWGPCSIIFCEQTNIIQRVYGTPT